MDIFLQLWGGGGYLLAKILLSHAEGLQDDRKWRIAGWLAYILGLPAWVILLVGKQDWIAAANEAGGGPALVLGFVLALKRLDKVHPIVDLGIRIFTYGMIIFGVSYRFWFFGGITAFSQILELGVTIGFLLGSYLLARKKASGWLFFALMLISMGMLMYIQGKIILIFQQGISLIFAVIGFTRALHHKRNAEHAT
jgi:hypothetical protein